MSQLEPYAGGRTPSGPPHPVGGAHPVAAYRQPHTQVVTDQRPVSGALVTVAWVVAVVTALYMLPWAVAATRGKANHGTIALINALLGWSFVGWVVALVMACQAHQVVSAPMSVNIMVAQQFSGHAQPHTTDFPPAGWYPSPDGAGQQYWDGGSWTGHRAP
ncbi:superinfection immunity protein [Cellulomonas fimi]|uniref:Superinfection immunity protein n=1 Tax=Cellulomonas fimi TaxID=1708 RepID=A0A7Y0QGN2_CELFI|nr:superinfection immunity protein [Cellulomonas fimi]NMR19064.1 superinfection immunity protein [Cellulomonas fimi]